MSWTEKNYPAVTKASTKAMMAVLETLTEVEIRAFNDKDAGVTLRAGLKALAQALSRNELPASVLRRGFVKDLYRSAHALGRSAYGKEVK
jgi:hypothetical protein